MGHFFRNWAQNYVYLALTIHSKNVLKILHNDKLLDEDGQKLVKF